MFTAWFFAVLGELFGGLPVVAGDGRKTKFFSRLPGAIATLGEPLDDQKLRQFDIWDLAMLAWVIRHHKDYLEKRGILHASEKAWEALRARVFKPSPLCHSPWRGPGEWARAARIFADLGDVELAALCIKRIRLVWRADDSKDPYAAGHFEPPLMDGEPATLDKVVFANSEVRVMMERLDPPELRPFRDATLDYVVSRALPREEGEYYYKSGIVTEDLFISACAVGAIIAGRRAKDEKILLGLTKYLETMRTENELGLGPVASIALLDALVDLRPNQSYFNIHDDRKRPAPKPKKESARNEIERNESVLSYLWQGARGADAAHWMGKNQFSTAGIQAHCKYRSPTATKERLMKLVDLGWVNMKAVPEWTSGRGRAIEHWHLTLLGEEVVPTAVKELARAARAGEHQGSNAS